MCSRSHDLGVAQANNNLSKLVANLDAPYQGLKVANSSTGDLNFLVYNLAYPNGTAYNPETAVAARSTARFYSDNYVRHWDTWLTKERYSVFAGTLSVNSSYGLAGVGLRNLLQDVNYTTTRPESPVQPFGGNTDFDISPDGQHVAILSKAPELNKANYTASYLYIGPFDGSSVVKAFNGPGSDEYEAGHKGASGQPTFSPDSKTLAYIKQDEDYYESDRWQLYTVDIESDYSVSNYKALSSHFDRWVETIQWAPNGQCIYTTAEDYARTRIFKFPLDAPEDYVPKNLTWNSTVSGFSVLPDETLLVSATALWSNRDFYTTKGDGEQNILFTAATELGLSSDTVEEFFYTGSQGGQLHSLIVKPTGYSKNKTYPLAYIIHGGPQGSNGNVWSTRWNFQVWADQGYVVVAPNPTGSTGFGQKLIDDIQGRWGSWPYQDIVLGWNYVKENLSYVDTENGIEAGASYGGYMTNWIQGHELGRKFKALVTHDGISHTRAAYATEELWFIRHDYNGTVFDEYATYAEWDPFNYIHNFSTPHFIVHNTLDYRLPESDGIALFNILQTKGVPSRFLNFPDENHWVLNPENSLFWHTEIFNWINHYSGIGGDLDDVPIGS